MSPDGFDSREYLLIKQLQGQLNRIQDDIDRVDNRFEAVRNAQEALGNRLTAIETWKTERDREQVDQVSFRQYIGGLLIACTGVLIGIIGLVAHH